MSQLPPTTTTAPAPAAKEQIKECFNCWTKSWNQGDLNGYLTGYFDSSHTRYVSGKKVTIGKQNIRDLLKSRGGPKGILKVVSLDVGVMNDCNDAICFGQYELKLPSSKSDNDTKNSDINTSDCYEIHTGCFTVHVRKLQVEGDENDNANWKIISDHST